MVFLLNAAEGTAVVSSAAVGTDYYNLIFTIALLIIMILLLVAAITIHYGMKSILRITMAEAVKAEEEKRKEAKLQTRIKRQAIWNNMLGVRPIEEEKDIMMDHTFDGIQELDNPIPIWFNALFYTTVVFGVVYLLVYHVFGWGLNQDQEYLHEVAQAEKAKLEYLAQSANLVDENTVTFNAALAPAGKAIFVANCVACHGANGEGGIGPNLTDRFWLHGGEIKDVFKTVKYGVPEKGMVPWEQTLTPGQISEVSNYILTLRDTKPANAKAAEGVEVKAYEAESNTDTETDASADGTEVTEN